MMRSKWGTLAIDKEAEEGKTKKEDDKQETESHKKEKKNI